MNPRASRPSHALALATLAFLVAVACGGGPRDTAPKTGAARHEAPASVTAAAAIPTPEQLTAMESRLAHADAADGSVDKVVAKCTGCGLGMEGNKDHAVVVGDYTLHLCSDSCQQVVAKDPVAAVMTLPES